MGIEVKFLKACLLFKMFKLTLTTISRRIITSNNIKPITSAGYHINYVNLTRINNRNRNYSHFESVLHKETKDNNNKDKEYVLTRLKHDPDSFGPKPIDDDSVQEEWTPEELQEENYMLNEKPLGKRLTGKQYGDIIKSLLAKQKIQEAIDVVEIRMAKQDKVKPENYHYNLLIGACGRLGYTKKAFRLYNDMKRRDLKTHDSVYTSLFNSCANSPWQSSDGLTRAKHLLDIITEIRYEPNKTNYHAMIKAFGRCGDLSVAFSLVDEMVSKGFAIKDDTINMLLQACISDKEAGFRHSLLVWRKLIEKNIRPTLFTYNLLLRSVRDCSLGDLEVTKDIIEKILPKNDEFLQLSQTDHSELIAVGKFEVENIQSGGFKLNRENRPDLLSKNAHMGDIIELSEIRKPEDRLLLLGGFQNIVENMKNNDCVPDNKTFTQLLDCIPSTLSAEQELLKTMKKVDIKPDLAFFNMLIKKRAMRFDYQASREVMVMINKARYLPDLITFGVLSLGCRNRDEAEMFLHEMESSGYRVNIEILGAMLKQACCHQDFPYVLFIMQKIVAENVAPSPKLMETLSEFYRECKRVSNDKNNIKSRTRSFVKGYQTFKMAYATWKTKVQPEQEPHPWKAFREPVVKTDVTHFKDKHLKSRFKPRHQSKFRVKTSERGEIVENFVPRKYRKPRTEKPKKLLNQS